MNFMHHGLVNEQPASNREKTITCCLGLGVLMLAFVAIIGLALWDSPTNAWERIEVGGAALQAPFKLAYSPDQSQRVLEAIKRVEPLVESVSTWKDDQNSDRFVVGLLRIEYNPTVVPNLDASIAGAISSGTAKHDDPNPKYTVSTLRISNLEARKAVCHSKVQGVDLQLDTVVVARGSTMWQFQAVHVTPDMVATVERIVASLEILPH